MIYGYARVSTKDQDLTSQIQALREMGAVEIRTEKFTGKTKEGREVFNELLNQLQPGDTLAVTKMDRFARSTKDALETIDQLEKKGVRLIVLNMGGDKFDTTTPMGKLMVTVLSGIAEFELTLIKERQREGIALAKQKGLYQGRPAKYTDKHKGLQYAMDMFADRHFNKLTVDEIADITNISRATLYREARKRGL